jgi:glucosyl-3-phosphoglycerate phosphatase
VTADRLLLWRHGRTASNANGRFQGQQDVPLDDVGRVQVKCAAELIADRVGGGECCIVGSDLRRAAATAQALSERLGLSVESDPELREVHAGVWEGLLQSEIIDRFPAEYAAWRAGQDVRVGGGERRSEAGERAERAISRHASAMPGGLLVVASHGAALRGALVRLLGLPGDSWVRFDGLRNAHWAELVRRRDSWVLGEYNVGPPEPAQDEATVAEG